MLKKNIMAFKEADLAMLLKKISFINIGSARTVILQEQTSHLKIEGTVQATL